MPAGDIQSSWPGVACVSLLPAGFDGEARPGRIARQAPGSIPAQGQLLGYQTAFKVRHGSRGAGHLPDCRPLCVQRKEAMLKPSEQTGE